MLSTVYQISFVPSCLHDLQPRYNYLPFFNWQNAQIFTTSIYDLLIVLNVINCYFRGWVFLGSIFCGFYTIYFLVFFNVYAFHFGYSKLMYFFIGIAYNKTTCARVTTNIERYISGWLIWNLASIYIEIILN